MPLIESPGFEIPESVVRELAGLDRLAQKGVALVPPPNFIADFVRLQRTMLGCKQEALASLAGVSLSTLQRIERGEIVSKNSLDRVAAVLGQRPYAFTEPRVPLRVDQLQQKINDGADTFKGRILVPVRRLRTQPQVAALTRAHLYLVDGGRLSDTFDNDVAALEENLDFVSYVLTTEEEGSNTFAEPLKRRELYIRVLDSVRAIERKRNAVALAGVYEAQPNATIMPTAHVALIGFFPRSTDPGAVKRRVLLAPAKIDLVEAWDRFCRSDSG